MMNTKNLLLAVAGCVVSGAGYAAGQASTNFAIPHDAINNGVAGMSSTNFALSGSVGESVSTGSIASASFQLRNGFRATLNVSPAVLNLLTVLSSKMHGATTFSLPVAIGQPLGGSITVEPRAIGGGHTLVFHFDGPVTSVGAATALDALMMPAGTASVSAVGGDAVVTLTNVADNKRLTITLSGLNGTATAMASMGFLVGDVSNSRAVNAADISAVKANQNQPVNTLYRALFDLNADGTINQADVNAAKARSGLVLAP